MGVKMRNQIVTHVSQHTFDLLHINLSAISLNLVSFGELVDVERKAFLFLTPIGVSVFGAVLWSSDFQR